MFSFINNGQYKYTHLELGNLLSSLYNDPEVVLVPDVMLMKSEEDIKNVIPRSSMILPYGVPHWPSFDTMQMRTKCAQLGETSASTSASTSSTRGKSAAGRERNLATIPELQEEESVAIGGDDSNIS